MKSEKLSITEIRAKLPMITSESNDLILALRQDSRKGVQSALKSWDKNRQKQMDLVSSAYMMTEFERGAFRQGFQLIAGVDEVGRGPLAGPVIAAAVILPNNFQLLEVDDSKKLSASKREELYMVIQEQAVSIGIGIMDERVIDNVNIYQATKMAMTEAIQKLSFSPDYLLLDAMTLSNFKVPQQNIVKGDQKSVSIAAASIIAKVTRDQLMVDYGAIYPGYGFEKNAGYGTKEHLLGLDLQGPCKIHRQTFAPVKNMVAQN